MSTGSNRPSFRVALVGRPNVGKSSLYNFLTRTRAAVVKNQPGVTRDVQSGVADWWGHQFEVLDTGGLTEQKDAFSPLIYEQVLNLLKCVDLMVVILDGKSGMTPEDREVFRIVRAAEKPYVLVVNKVDKDSDAELLTSDFYELGEDLIPVSIEQRVRTDEVVEKIIEHIPEDQTELEESFRIAIVGKPNVGKSSLTNRVLGERRVLVSDVAGTTVDAIEERFEYKGDTYTLVDTAGLRRQGKRFRRDDGVEILSSYKTMEAISKADVVLLVIDALEGPAEQDAKIAAAVIEQAKPLMIVANKSDLAREERESYREWFADRMRFVFHFAADLPIVYTSAETGKGIHDVFKCLNDIRRKINFKISTSKLNDFFYEVIRQAPSPVWGTKNVKFYYLTQTNQKPPSFIAFANHPDGVTPAYRRFLIQRIKDQWDLQGIPVRVYIMKSGEGKNRRSRRDEVETEAEI